MKLKMPVLLVSHANQYNNFHYFDFKQPISTSTIAFVNPDLVISVINKLKLTKDGDRTDI